MVPCSLVLKYQLKKWNHRQLQVMRVIHSIGLFPIQYLKKERKSSKSKEFGVLFYNKRSQIGGYKTGDPQKAKKLGMDYWGLLVRRGLLSICIMLVK